MTEIEKSNSNVNLSTELTDENTGPSTSLCTSPVLEAEVRLLPPASCDGVFANMAAKPEHSSKNNRPPVEPPPYGDANETRPPEYIPTTEMADSVHDVIYDDEEVGGWDGFIVFGLVSVFFQFIGFVIAYALAKSHATRHGSLAGLGLTLAFTGSTLDGGKGSIIRGSTAPWIGLLLVLFGYALVIFSIIQYRNIRIIAKQFVTPRADENNVMDIV